MTEQVVLERTTETAPQRHQQRSRFDILRPSRFSGVYIVALFILIFGLWVPDTFLTTTTAQSLLGSQSITAILAIGLLFPLCVGAYDLSIGNTFGLASIAAASLTAKHHVDPVLTVVIVLGIGLVVGAVNGVLIVVIGLDSFICTLGSSSVLLAVIDYVSDNQVIADVPNSFAKIASPQPFGIPIIAIYMAILGVIVWYVLEHTPVGRRLHAIGANAEASRLAGVPAKGLTFAALLASGLIASFAGILLTARITSASPTAGSSYLLPVFAAALLGATQIHQGRINVPGTIVAMALLAIGVQGLQLVGANIWVTDLFNGGALIIAISFAALSRTGVLRKVLQRRVRRRTGPSALHGGSSSE